MGIKIQLGSWWSDDSISKFSDRVFETTVSIKAFFPLKFNLILLCKLKGSSAVEASEFNYSRHSTGKASITEISLNVSNSEMFNSLNL